MTPHEHQHRVLSMLLTTPILLGMKWYVMALVSIFLLTNNTEHLFMSLFIKGFEQEMLFYNNLGMSWKVKKLDVVMIQGRTN